MPIFQRETILPPPAEKRIQTLQNSFQISFPSSYLRFIDRYNGVNLTNGVVRTSLGEFVLEFFLPIVNDIKYDARGSEDLAVVAAQLDWGLVGDENAIGLELVPIAAMYAGNYLVLDYRIPGNEPRISYWNHELSSEFSPHAVPIFSSFQELWAMIDEDFGVKI